MLSSCKSSRVRQRCLPEIFFFLNDFSRVKCDWSRTDKEQSGLHQLGGGGVWVWGWADTVNTLLTCSDWVFLVPFSNPESVTLFVVTSSVWGLALWSRFDFKFRVKSGQRSTLGVQPWWLTLEEGQRLFLCALWLHSKMRIITFSTTDSGWEMSIFHSKQSRKHNKQQNKTYLCYNEWSLYRQSAVAICIYMPSQLHL